jgi:hypothetical protein
MRQQQQKINEKNIVRDKVGLTHEISDLNMRYIKSTCLSCVLDHEVEIIRYKSKLIINKSKIAKLRVQI